MAHVFSPAPATAMKHLRLTYSLPCSNVHLRNHSACSDAFGPKIVSTDVLPGTPMDHRSSMEDDLNRTPVTADLEVPHFLNGLGSAVGLGTGSSSTRLVVKNELSERRRSLEYVNRPPSPSHFIQFTAKKGEPQQFTDESPLTSPKTNDHQNQRNNNSHNHNHQPFNKNGSTTTVNNSSQSKEEKIRANYNINSQDGLNNGIMSHGSTVNVASNGRDKEADKEVTKSIKTC